MADRLAHRRICRDCPHRPEPPIPRLGRHPAVIRCLVGDDPGTAGVEAQAETSACTGSLAAGTNPGGAAGSLNASVRGHRAAAANCGRGTQPVQQAAVYQRCPGPNHQPAENLACPGPPGEEKRQPGPPRPAPTGDRNYPARCARAGHPPASGGYSLRRAQDRTPAQKGAFQRAGYIDFS